MTECIAPFKKSMPLCAPKIKPEFLIVAELSAVMPIGVCIVLPVRRPDVLGVFLCCYGFALFFDPVALERAMTLRIVTPAITLPRTVPDIFDMPMRGR